MRGAPIVIGVCVGVLAAALLFAHQWSSEEPQLPPVQAAPVSPGPVASPTFVSPGEVPQEDGVALPGEAVPRQRVASRNTADGAVAVLPVLEQSPYLGESRELDYAERLLTEPRVAMNRVESAKGVFDRCLEAHPGLERCEKGQAAAASLIGEARTGAVQLTIEGPSTAAGAAVKSLQPTAPNTRIPKPRR